MTSLRPASDTARTRDGFTLLELGLVVLVVGLLAALAATRLSGVLGDARRTVAEADLETLREAFLGDGRGNPGLVADLDGIPGFSAAYLRPANLLAPTNLVGAGGRWLDDDGRRLADAGFASRAGASNPDQAFAPFATFTNRDDAASRGWRGPYVRRVRTAAFPSPGERRFSGDATFGERGFFPRGTGAGARSFGVPGEPCALDPWGNPYVLQVPPAEAFERPGETGEDERFRHARLVSAGPDGILSTPCFGAATRGEARLAGMRPDGTAPARGDDLVLFLLRADLHED